MIKFTLMFSALSMAIAITLGAFGAHGLKGILSAERLQTFHTAVNYQIIHSLALLALAALMFHLDNRLLKISVILFIAGILFFSGSLYLLIATGKTWLGAMTPIGGTAFIAGWIWVAYVALTQG